MNNERPHVFAIMETKLAPDEPEEFDKVKAEISGVIKDRYCILSYCSESRNGYSGIMILVRVDAPLKLVSPTSGTPPVFLGLFPECLCSEKQEGKPIGIKAIHPEATADEQKGDPNQEGRVVTLFFQRFAIVLSMLPIQGLRCKD